MTGEVDDIYKARVQKDANELMKQIEPEYAQAARRIDKLVNDLCDPGVIGGGLDPGVIASMLIGSGIGMLAVVNPPEVATTMCKELIEAVYTALPEKVIP